MINNDRRILKTQQLIHEALLSLMMEKPYDKITIQDIIDKANIGRSTFYSHYETKDELLKNSIEQMLNMLNQHLSNTAFNTDTPRLIAVFELFEHIKENSRLMKALIKANSTDLFIEKAQVYWNEKIEEILRSKLIKNTEIAVPLNILTNYICNTLFFLLKWWLNDKMQYSSTQMEQYFLPLVNPTVESILGRKLKE